LSLDIDIKRKLNIDKNISLLR